MTRYALDTGPLVAFLNRHDSFHAWARSILDSVRPPLFTCEPVLSEACFLLRHSPSGPDAVFELLQRGLLVLDFSVADNLLQLRKLLAKYRSVPMSLADACLVRMSELDSTLSVISLDRDFRLYRRLGRGTIPVIAP